METFGTNEKPLSLTEKERIKQFLKNDSHVPARLVEQVVSAERFFFSSSEAEYFQRLGFFTGAVTSAAFFFFPVVRQ